MEDDDAETGATGDGGDAPEVVVVVNTDGDGDGNEPEGNPPPSDTTVVVVTDGGDAAGDEIDRFVAIEQRFGSLETRIDEAIETMYRLATPAVEEVVVIPDLPDVEEVDDEDGDEDEVVPTNAHPYFRPFRDWFKS